MSLLVITKCDTILDEAFSKFDRDFAIFFQCWSSMSWTIKHCLNNNIEIGVYIL